MDVWDRGLGEALMAVVIHGSKVLQWLRLFKMVHLLASVLRLFFFNSSCYDFQGHSAGIDSLTNLRHVVREAWLNSVSIGKPDYIPSMSESSEQFRGDAKILDGIIQAIHGETIT